MSERVAELSILIVSYNTLALLRECLTSIIATTSDMMPEITVVDNHSEDGSARMVAEEFPGVTLIANERNAGFAAANNEAYRQCGGNYVLLLNPDTIVHGSAITDMLAYLKQHADVGIVTCRLLNSDGTTQRSVRAFPSILRNLGEIVGRSVYEPDRFYRAKDAQDIQDVIGACLMLRRAALDDEDPFDERFFLYSEDKDLCWRVRQSGWRIVFLPWAEITHHGGQSAGSVDSFVQLQKSQLLFYRKHYSRQYACLLGFTWWSLILSRYLAILVLGWTRPGSKDGLRTKAAHFRAANAWLARHVWHPRRMVDC